MSSLTWRDMRRSPGRLSLGDSGWVSDGGGEGRFSVSSFNDLYGWMGERDDVEAWMILGVLDLFIYIVAVTENCIFLDWYCA